MRGAFFYADCGKGHYIPAMALTESFGELGDGFEAEVFDIFEILTSYRSKRFIKKDWRFCLRHPRYERFQEGVMDTHFSSFLLKKVWSKKKYVEAFRAWYEDYKPDFIFATHMQAGLVFPVICKKLGIQIPIFQYEVDIFQTPVSGVPCDVYRYYCANEIGRKHAIRHGQPEATISMCTYPMRPSSEHYNPLHKHEIRKKLGLDDKFTILLSFGGEGIGRIDLLESLAAKGHKDIQTVIIGGASDEMSARLDDFSARYPDFKLYRPGFVNNVPEYVNAANIQVGNSGPNGLMESIYQKVPFIVTDLLHLGMNTREFLKQAPVGWVEKNGRRQAEIVEKLMAGGGKIQDEVYERTGIEVSVEKFRDLIISDVKKYYEENPA